MSSIYQKTLSKEVSFRGIGLHSGKNSSIKIIPAKENSGIVFKRVDLIKNNIIKANYSNVSSAKLCTTLENNFGIKVSTVEHLLAALYISDIDNAIIEVDSEEVPIMDGSAKNFLEVLNVVKLETQNKKRKFLKISEKTELLDGKRKISIEPNDNLEVDFQLDYENSLIGNQRNIVNLSKDNLDDISISRTFCLYEDIEKIKKNGLAKGGSLDNAVVVENDKILNKGGLRNKKEFVNHKILDLVGDFLLSGYRIIGKVKCYQGGHELTNMFLRKLLGSKSKLNRNISNRLKITNKLTNEPITKLAANA
tara:strand:+ start:429 stop:1352 length:924 start_codon:yes stop_codon:yes gene_type:complete